VAHVWLAKEDWVPWVWTFRPVIAQNILACASPKRPAASWAPAKCRSFNSPSEIWLRPKMGAANQMGSLTMTGVAKYLTRRQRGQKGLAD